MKNLLLRVVAAVIDAIIVVAQTIYFKPIDWLAGKIESAVWEVVYAYDRRKIQQRQAKRKGDAR